MIKERRKGQGVVFLAVLKSAHQGSSSKRSKTRWWGEIYMRHLGGRGVKKSDTKKPG